MYARRRGCVHLIKCKYSEISDVHTQHGLFIDQSHRGRSQIRVTSSIVGFKRIFYSILFYFTCSNVCCHISAHKSINTARARCSA